MIVENYCMQLKKSETRRKKNAQINYNLQPQRLGSLGSYK